MTQKRKTACQNDKENIRRSALSVTPNVVRGLLLSFEEVDRPSLTNGGGISPILELHPENFKYLFGGKFEGGPLTLSIN